MARLILILTALLATSAFAQDSTLDRIQRTKTLKVCVWPEYFGISYRDPKTLKLSGIDVEMAQSLASDLGVNIEFVDSSFARLVSDVTESRCEVAMFAIGVTPSRMEKLRFTTPHLASDIYAITTKSNRRIKTWSDIDKPGVVVAVAKGTLHEPVMREKLQQATLKVFDTPHAREQEVESGRADVFMTDFPYSRRMLKTTDWARVVKPETDYHITPYAYAIRHGDDAWHKRLEQFIADAKKDGRLKSAAARHELSAILNTR